MTLEGALLQNPTRHRLSFGRVRLAYKNLTDYNRGHLNPNSHQTALNAKKPTFSLTNFVPQYIKLDGGTWNNYAQQMVMSHIQGSKGTFGLVGVVPGNNYIAGGRVNQPCHLWSAACSFIDNNYISPWAIIATNDKDKVKHLTLGQPEEKLMLLDNWDGISLFHSDCP